MKILYLIGTLIGFCCSCSIHSCLKCENKILDYKSFLTQESFNNIKCFDNSDHSFTCKSNECLTQIHIMYSSEYETKTLQDLKSHMVFIKRDCKIENVKSLCNWKKSDKRYMTYCDINCHGTNCNSKLIFNEITDNIHRFVPTCLTCEAVIDKNHYVINGTCNMNGSPSTHELCFGKCYMTTTFKNKYILIKKGCVNDVNGFSSKKEYGITYINDIIVYSLCDGRLYSSCNSNDKQMNINITNLKLMNTFLYDIEKSDIKNICLSCKSKRVYKDSETNCEKGIKSSEFNIVECSQSCYTKVVSNKYKILVIRGCGKVNSKHLEQPRKIKNKLYCSDCVSICKPRNEIICNSKHYMLIYEETHNGKYIGNNTNQINLFKVKKDIITKNKPSNYSLIFKNKLNIKKLTQKIIKYIKNNAHRRRNQTKIKFMQNSYEEIMLQEITTKETPINDDQNKIIKKEVMDSLRVEPTQRHITRYNVMNKDNKKLKLIKLLKILKKTQDTDDIENALKTIKSIDESELEKLFKNEDILDHTHIENKISYFEDDMTELENLRINYIHIYMSHFIDYTLALKTTTQDNSELINSLNDELNVCKIHIKDKEESIKEGKDKLRKDLYILYGKINNKMSNEVGTLMKYLLDISLDYDIELDYTVLQIAIQEEIKIQSGSSSTSSDNQNSLDSSRILDIEEPIELSDQSSNSDDVEIFPFEIKELTEDLERELRVSKEMTPENKLLLDNEVNYKQIYRWQIKEKLNKLASLTNEEYNDNYENIKDDLKQLKNPILKEKEIHYNNELFSNVKFINDRITTIGEQLNKDNNELQKMKKDMIKLQKLAGKISISEMQSNQTKYIEDIERIESEIGKLENRIIDFEKLKDAEYVNSLSRNYKLQDKEFKKYDSDYKIKLQELNDLSDNLVTDRETYIKEYQSFSKDNKVYATTKALSDSTNSISDSEEYEHIENQEIAGKDMTYHTLLNQIEQEIKSNSELVELNNLEHRFKTAQNGMRLQYMTKLLDDISVPKIIKMQKLDETARGHLNERLIPQESLMKIYKDNKIMNTRRYAKKLTKTRMRSGGYITSEIARLPSSPVVETYPRIPMRTWKKVGKIIIGVSTVSTVLGGSLLTYLLLSRQDEKLFPKEESINYDSNDLNKDLQININGTLDNFSKKKLKMDEKPLSQISTSKVKKIIEKEKFDYDYMMKLKKGIETLPTKKEPKFEASNVILPLTGAMVIAVSFYIFIKIDGYIRQKTDYYDSV